MTENLPAAAARSVHWWQRGFRLPCASLLAVQLAMVVIFPFIPATSPGRVGFGVFGVLVLAATIGMVRHTAHHAWVSFLIAVPVIVLSVAQWWTDNTAVVLWAAALEALFYFHAAGVLIRYMLADRRATTDELFGAGATLTLLAWGYTYVYTFCQVLQPHSFSMSSGDGTPLTWMELTYLSFVLISSTGIGDISPVTPLARGLSILEMFTGVMYIALVVSRLVGLTLMRKPPG